MKRKKKFIIAFLFSSVISFCIMMALPGFFLNRELGHQIGNSMVEDIHNTWAKEYIVWVFLIAIVIGLIIGGIVVLFSPQPSKNIETMDPDNFPTNISYNDLKELYKRKYNK